MISNRLASSLLCLTLLGTGTYAQAQTAFILPPPTVDEAPGTAHSETAVFAGGCFWGVQGVYQHVKGVSRAVSGYAGGVAQTAHYDDVSEGDTGHAESVQVTFDPTQVSYGQLLQIYFSVVHNPTELNRQGPDTGTQYRSTVFAQTPEQHRVADAYLKQLNAANVYGKPLVTTIEDRKEFFAAEGYHQDYLTLHSESPYITINDLPKVQNLARAFPAQYLSAPVLVNP